MAHAGARKITTVEYNPIASGMSKLQAMTPRDLATAWLADTLDEVSILAGCARSRTNPQYIMWLF